MFLLSTILASALAFQALGGESWLPVVVGFATFVLGLFEGKGIFPVVAWLKAKTGSQGIWTFVLAGLVSLVFGTATVFAGGQISPETWNLNHIFFVVGTALLASQGVYLDYLKKRL